MKNIINIIFFLLIICAIKTDFAWAGNYDDFQKYLYPRPEKTISMDFKDADLNNVLKIFSQQSGLNFIASSDVATKKINLYLDQVDVEEALEQILSANDLTYEIKPDSNVFIVKELTNKSPEVITRIYRLNYATLPSSKLNKTLSAFGDKGTTTGSSTGIIDAVKSLLSENGSVIEDTRTNSLIVKDYPSQFSIIEQTIKRLDVRTPQILIEAELLDISKDTSDVLGAKWGDSPLVFQAGARRDAYPFNYDDILDDGNTTFDFPDDIENRYTASNVSFEGLRFTLQFLHSQSDTKSLARPRILTLNNETAEISIKTNEAIGIIQNESGDTNSTTTEAERVETGVFLTVTPQANMETGEITLAIEPKVSEANSSSTFNGIAFKNPEERATKSILRIQDGDTIVMGGLLRTDFSNDKTRVPYLSKIPVIGSGFRHKNKSEGQRELIIFITPSIVKENFNTKTREANISNIIREQPTVSSNRLNQIDQELSSSEKNF